MTEHVTKTKKVTFKTGLPMGTRAEFTHDGESWVAWPASKSTSIIAVQDRLVGLNNWIRGEMLRWIGQRPQDADLVVRVIEATSKIEALNNELITDRVKARTA